MKTTRLTVNAAEGLHARPAHLFVSLTGSFESEIQVRNLTTGSDFVDAKSILSILTLGVVGGHEVEISAEGSDEKEAIAKIEWLIKNDFPDDE
jgi:phosphotransferase system HPr (HPr) family protein